MYTQVIRKMSNILFINIYASSEENITKYDLNNIVGDFNAKIGNQQAQFANNANANKLYKWRKR